MLLADFYTTNLIAALRLDLESHSLDQNRELG
jgi:hypothetical protein